MSLYTHSNAALLLPPRHKCGAALLILHFCTCETDDPHKRDESRRTRKWAAVLHTSERNRLAATRKIRSKVKRGNVRSKSFWALWSKICITFNWEGEVYSSPFTIKAGGWGFASFRSAFSSSTNFFFSFFSLLQTNAHKFINLSNLQYRLPLPLFFFLFLKHQNFPSIERPNKSITAASAYQSPPNELQLSHHDFFFICLFKKNLSHSTVCLALSSCLLLPCAHSPHLPDDINT